MSTYHAMWEKIKEMPLEEVEAWIQAIAPARGGGLDFRGVRVCDSDLLEALRNYQEDLEREHRVKTYRRLEVAL